MKNNQPNPKEAVTFIMQATRFGNETAEADAENAHEEENVC